MNKKYCIYYISTGIYINDAYEFFESLKNFMPNNLITVIWLADNFIKVPKYDNIDIIQKYILDMPWPLVTLLKMHYIYNNKLNGYNGYFYFNANSKLLQMHENTINTINNALNENKLITMRHACGIYDDNYRQSGFFGGTYDIFYDTCNKVINTINKYLCDNIIPEWHDETVLNEVINKYNINHIIKGFGFFNGGFSYEEALNKFNFYPFIEFRESGNKAIKDKDNL